MFPKNGYDDGPGSIRTAVITAWMTLALAATPLAAQQGDPSLPPGTWDLLVQACDTITNAHFNPPAKQQFILVAARSIYRLHGATPPRELSRQVSLLTNDDEFRIWLGEHWANAIANRSGEEQPSLLTMDQQLVAMTLTGIDSRLNYISARQQRVQQQLKDNQYVGIGIQVAYKDGFAVIRNPFPGGAAAEAGAVPGDVILEVDGRDMQGKSLPEIVDILRGNRGSKVSVTVRTKNDEQPRKLDMVRDVIPIASLHGLRQNKDGSWEFMADQDAAVAYIKINDLVGSTAAELQDAARQIKSRNCQGVVLDFQNVLDADLHHANMVADVLMGGVELGTLAMADGSTRTLVTRDENSFAGLPMAVLLPFPQTDGPMFALLSALRNRPKTVLIGNRLVGSLYCFDSVQMDDSGAAIGMIPVAKFDFPTIERANQSQHVRGESAVIEPSIRVSLTNGSPSPGGEMTEAARKWLSENN